MNADFVAYNGLIKVIEIELQQLRKLGRYDISFEVKGERIFLSPQKELVAFRIVQEAMNNIIKHAECNKINIGLTFEKEGLLLTI